MITLNRSKPVRSSTPESPRPNGPANRFTLASRIARAVGKSSRYASDAVRVLPGAKPTKTDDGHVILEATDGKQAVCVMTPGHVERPRLVPAEVLPTRQLKRPAAIGLVDGQWQTSEGKLAEDRYAEGEHAFPPIADVLPQVGRKPHTETVKRAERRRQSGQAGDAAAHDYVWMAVDLDVLRKTAEGLGTSKLAMFIPVPIAGQPGDGCVTKPIAISPAMKEGQTSGAGAGVGVVMPLTPENGPRDYEAVRQAVVEAEKRAKGKS